MELHPLYLLHRESFLLVVAGVVIGKGREVQEVLVGAEVEMLETVQAELEILHL